jgi:phosphate acetyltransferase
MDFQKELRRKAAQNPLPIVLPESENITILKGAEVALREGLAQIILLGSEETILKRAKKEGLNLREALFRDPLTDPSRNIFGEKLWQKRRNKGLLPEKALKLMDEPLWFGAMTLLEGETAGMVAGASYTSTDVLHAALRVIGPASPKDVVSVAGFIQLPRLNLGEEGLFLFADCVVVENPNASQLASIALEAARTWQTFVSPKPRVALISYSTKGSCPNLLPEKVREATRIIREKAPDLICDGELQFDAAVNPEIARKKAPQSPVEGRANVLIFPDLNSGNSNFKNAEQLAGGRFMASVVQGLSKPINDLSRGTTAETVTDTIAATVLQAGATNEK